MRRIAAEVELDGRKYQLVVDTDGGRVEIAWYQGRMFVERATALEEVLGLMWEAKRKECVRLKCNKNQEKDCFDCPETDCPNYWGEMFKHTFVVREEDRELIPPEQREKKDASKETDRSRET